MSNLTYEESKKRVFFGFWLLFIVTLIEVFFSLLGKGHIFEKAVEYRWLIWLCALVIIVLSVYKAYFIIFDFMHMKYEIKGLALTVLLPTLLLVWGLIAFSMEGKYWKKRRTNITPESTKIVPGSKDLGARHDDQTKNWADI